MYFFYSVYLWKCIFYNVDFVYCIGLWCKIVYHSSIVRNADCFKYLLYFWQEQKTTIAPNKAGKKKKKGKVGVSRTEWGRGRGVGRRLAMHHCESSPDCGSVFPALHTQQQRLKAHPPHLMFVYQTCFSRVSSAYPLFLCHSSIFASALSRLSLC